MTAETFDRPVPATLFTQQDGIATLTFNDAARMNPLSADLLSGALEALTRVRDDASIRCLVLAANGRGFSTGADLADLQRRQADGERLGDIVGALMETGGHPLVKALRELPVPVVCAVQGAVAGGGVGIALACDIVVAARSAYFLLPFVPALGLVPDMGAAWFLPRAIGQARSVAMTLLGRRLDAQQAADWGLIWAAVDDDRLADDVAAIAARLAALPGHAIGEAWALFAAAATSTLAELLSLERERQIDLVERAAFAEGVAAFLGRRTPVFAGRRP